MISGRFAQVCNTVTLLPLIAAAAALGGCITRGIIKPYTFYPRPLFLGGQSCHGICNTYKLLWEHTSAHALCFFWSLA